MGVFSRFRDIINSNINAMLEKAENPEKLIKLMIQEMEDTLVEMKASCASAMANRVRLNAGVTQVQANVEEWEMRARLAVDKGRDDLAREAIVQKRELASGLDMRLAELGSIDEMVERHQGEIVQLEEKMATARAKYKLLLQREKLAQERKTSQTRIRKAENTDAFARFEHVEKRVDRIEAEADLVNVKREFGLEDEFKRLEQDDGVEAELDRIKGDVAAKPVETTVQS